MAAAIAAAIVTYFAIESAVAIAAIYIATYVAVAVAVSLTVNAILSPSSNQGNVGASVDSGSNKDPGVQSRLRINTDNKLGVGYGTFWVKGAEVFGQASQNFKEAYYAVVMSEAISGYPNTMQSVFWDEYKLTLKPYDAVTSVSVSSGGSYSYGARPTATVAAPLSGTTATVSVNMTDVTDEEGNPLYSYVSSVSVTNGGSGYATNPTITFSSGSAAATTRIGENAGWVQSAVDAAGNTVNDFNNYVRIQFFPNGLPTYRGDLPSISYFQTATNLLSNYSCAVITVKYNRDKQIFGLKDMTFCLSNTLTAPGSVLQDYMTNTLYGCGLPLDQVDIDSLAELNTYSAQTLSSVSSTGAVVNLPRYTLQGVVNTNQNCWKNIEDLMFSCGCYPRVNNQTGQYGVYIDRAATEIAYAFDDTVITGASNLVTAEFSSVPNIAEVKFPRSIVASTGAVDTSFKGQSDTFTLSLPSNVVPANTQPNKYSLQYQFITNDVQAKRLAAIDLNNNALDLAYTFRTNHKAIEVVSGDVVSITSDINGWNEKLFRVLSVAEQEDQVSGNIFLEFFVKEYDAAVYTDSTVVQYPPAANVNGDSPRAQQSYSPVAPTPVNIDLAAPIPALSLNFIIEAFKVVDQIDVYYMVNTPNINNAVYMTSIYGSLNDGTFDSGSFTFPILGNGGYYAPQVVPAGTYYFACKYYNDGLATEWSEISEVVNWHPQTSQWSQKYAMFRFSNSPDGTGANPSPDGHRYMGIYNSFNPTSSNDPTLYTWFDLGSAISTSNQLFLRIYENRVLAYKMAATNPDSTLWNNAYNFPNPTNPVLDLDSTTGQYVKTAYQAGGSNYLTSVWNSDGSITFLLPSGTAVPGTTPISEIASLTVDSEGRLISFNPLEKLYCTLQEFTATTTNQTFSFTHIVNQTLVFMGGILLDPTEYTETSTTITIPSSYNGAVVQFASFKMTSNDGVTQYVPYTRTDITTVAGQDTYSVAFDEGSELLFVNGVFYHDADYSYPTLDSIKLGAPSLVSGNKITLVNFRLISEVAAPFGQAAGATVADSDRVDMTGKINTDYTITAINGVYYGLSDYNTSITQVILTDPALFSDNAVQSTTFASSGSA